MHFNDAILEYGFDCRARKLSDKTISNYQKQLRYFQRYLEAEFKINQVEEVRSFHVKQFLVSMDDKGRKPRYINDLLKVFKTFFNYMKKEGYNKPFGLRCGKMSMTIIDFFSSFSWITRERRFFYTVLKIFSSSLPRAIIESNPARTGGYLVTQTELLIRSTLDGSLQPSLFYRSSSDEKRPLLVGLHTWSFDRFNQIQNILPYAEKLDFHLLLPEFRGPNLATNPRCTQACASEYVLQDIRDVIDHVLTMDNVDADNILLLGQSGGGHAALMMAAKWPELFRAICAYVPITDLAAWAEENPNYHSHVLACCSDSREEMMKRSPIHYLGAISKANVKLFHGKYDPVVPVSHSINFFNRMIAEYPSARTYLDIFDGGHEINMEQAMYWLLSQYSRLDMTRVSG